MKKTTTLGFLLVLCLMCLGLYACSKDSAASWQEQYDLGIRYLSDGNYQEAILAFNAAIEIDPKQADAYLGLADAYEAMGDREMAIQVLQDALENVEDPDAVATIKVRLTALAPELELLGHTWEDATCTTPRTCSVCGETEGRPLDHTLAEANYQAPATCTVCGATEGGALTPDFETYGIVIDMEVGVHYPYETVCYNNENVKTVGDVVVLDYNVFESDGTHEAKEGYEWRVATFQIRFADYNARNYGYWYSYSREDYYNIRLNDDTAVHDDDGNATYTVNYNGEDMEAYYFAEYLSNGWLADNTAEITFTVNNLVPAGYDGCVFGVFDYSLRIPDGGYIFDIYTPDSFHYFRFA